MIEVSLELDFFLLDLVMNLGTKEFSRTSLPLTLQLDVSHCILQILSLLQKTNLNDYVEHVQAEEEIPLQSMNSHSRSNAEQVFTEATVVQGEEKAKGISSHVYNKTSSFVLSQM